MAGPRTRPYYRGDELPPVGFDWKIDGELIDFSAGWTFLVRLGTRSQPALVELDTVTGAALSPNVTISFDAGVLDPLPVGLADGVIIATTGGRQETMPFELPMHRSIDPPAP